jgi:Lanthionine synthetase C-like protein
LFQIHILALNFHFQIYKHERYLQAAKTCAEVIWKRGILKKGYGICHGVAGNGYALLQVYQCTGVSFEFYFKNNDNFSDITLQDNRYLYEALQFADWCTTYDEFQGGVPDRPNSLFEGLAGTIYFMIDVRHPEEAKFPAYFL